MRKSFNKTSLMIIAVGFFIFSIILGYYFYRRVVVVYNPTDLLSVREKNDIIYAVHMIPNDEMGETVYGMGRNYLYSYTDHITVNNNYFVALNEELDVDYKYTAMATLVIRYNKGISSASNPEINSKEYILDDTSGTFTTTTTVKNSYDIVLDNYRSEAEKFAKTVDIPISAEVRIDFTFDLDAKEDRFESTHTRSMTIPLSDEVYKVDLSSNKDQTKDYSVPNNGLFTIGFFANSLSIVLCYAIIFLCVRGLMMPDSLYREVVDKYLKTYDDNIINTDSPMNFDSYETLAIDEFKELLNLSYTTNTPIMFYENNQGGLFYVFYNNMIYLHVVKKNSI